MVHFFREPHDDDDCKDKLCQAVLSNQRGVLRISRSRILHMASSLIPQNEDRYEGNSGLWIALEI